MAVISTLMIAVCLLVFEVAASACSVPVFRYALERWPVSPYIALVIADAPLTAPEQDALSLIENASDAAADSLNLMVRQWTSEELAKSSLAKALPETEGGGTQLHLLFPVSEGIDAPIWSGSLTMPSARQIMNTPFRKSLAKKIIEGNSGVYILLESGNKARDDAVAKSLASHLIEVAEVLALPQGIIETDGSVTGEGPPSYDPLDRLQSAIPLKVAFTTMRLPRKGVDDMLVALLMSLETDLKEYSDQPMVFGVYGRGRVLPPLIGEGITLYNVGEVAAFLTGACSCQVKALNPGVDLLLGHDWDRDVFGHE